ncbi:hypothetical protein VTG60DRAFT_6857 [Thermothelomyces hinnuleus]
MKFCVALLLSVASGVWAAYWMEDLHRQGVAPFAEASRYSVFRNVKQWGAKGDGVTDDTAAINVAISDGDRCGGPDCVGSTTTPAIVYFPPGTYMISSPIISYYYTQIIGDPTNMPVIKASQNFPTNVLAMLDADRYMDNGRLNFLATNVFFRQLRNLVFDTTANCVFKLSSGEDDTHVGIFMEEGSGGMMADLIFHGGKYAARFGNQQYTMRNLTFYGCDTAIEQLWNWGWTYKSLKVVGSRYWQELMGGRFYWETRTGQSTTEYEDYSFSDFISARDHNAFSDGRTDDTDMINKVIQAAANSSYIAFLDAGYYRVTDTIFIPPNTRVMGEGLATVIMGTGEKFSDPNNPRPVVQVGKPGDTGFVEINDLIVSTQGPAAGAIMIEYNLNTPAAERICSPGSPPSGMWDVHVRVGGFRGSQLQVAECPTTPEKLDYVNPSCIAGYMGMHITPSARNLYMENSWIWVADHDVDDWNQTQISVFVARGMLVQGSRIWLVGSSVEHHALYQYQLLNASDVWMGQIQTETPYYQPNPPAPYPFTQLSDSIRDPSFTVDCRARETENSLRLQGNPPCAMAWGLRIIGSQNVVVYGAGLYSFFNNYNTSCSTVESGENCQARIFWVGPDTSDGAERQGSAEGEEMLAVELYNLNTIGSVIMITQSGSDMATWAQNRATFASTLAAFRSEGHMMTL